MSGNACNVYWSFFLPSVLGKMRRWDFIWLPWWLRYWFVIRNNGMEKCDCQKKKKKPQRIKYYKDIKQCTTFEFCLNQKTKTPLSNIVQKACRWSLYHGAIRQAVLGSGSLDPWSAGENICMHIYTQQTGWLLVV